MYAEIQGALASASAALDLLKTAKGIVDQTKLALAIQDVTAKLLETQGAALKLSESNALLQQRVSDLEQRIRASEEWESQAKDYELREVGRGVFAYVRHDAVEQYQSLVKLCAHCFHQEKKSLLQQSGSELRALKLTCHACYAEMQFDGYFAR